jgi:hypothetical protein
MSESKEAQLSITKLLEMQRNRFEGVQYAPGVVGNVWEIEKVLRRNHD